MVSFLKNFPQFSCYIEFEFLDYDGASTSEARDDTEKEQPDTDDGGDGVSSEGEKPLATGSNDVSCLLFL